MKLPKIVVFIALSVVLLPVIAVAYIVCMILAVIFLDIPCDPILMTKLDVGSDRSISIYEECGFREISAGIYYDVEEAAMPEGVRQQLTYPVHLFHIQFDDVYIYYQMDDPMYFFNMEDMWDDADEVLGPLLDQGKAITFSIEPYYSVLETGGLLPATETGTQFAMALAFTPEGARNLRAIPIAYQDGEDYGRLVLLQVPKGQYIMGPEQADAIIDQDPDISEKISWWNRRGTEVIRGHTTPLLIDGEVLYIEPIFIRSQQNSITQLKRVVVVFRGQAYMAETLEGALRLATSSQPPSPQVAINFDGG